MFNSVNSNDQSPITPTASEAFKNLTPQATPLIPPTTTPAPTDANTTALQGQLNSESAARMYGNTLSTGMGLLDQPTTTSRILLGS